MVFDLFFLRKSKSMLRAFAIIVISMAVLFSFSFIFIGSKQASAEFYTDEKSAGSDYQLSCSGASCTRSHYIGRKFYIENGEQHEVNTEFERYGSGWKADKNIFSTYVNGNTINLRDEQGSEFEFHVPDYAVLEEVAGNNIRYDISRSFSTGNENYFMNAKLDFTLNAYGLDKMITIYNLSLPGDFEYAENYTSKGAKFEMDDVVVWYETCSGYDEARECENHYYPAQTEKKNGIFSFSIGEQWLDSAQYPIYIDPVVRYNFTDYTNNIAYEYDYNGAQPPAWADGWLGSVVSQSCYTNLSSSNNIYCSFTSSSAQNEPYMRFNFTINQSYGIDWIHVSMEQKANSNKAGEDCAFVIANFTSGQWERFYATDATTTEYIGYRNYTSGFDDIISGNQLVLMSSGDLMDSGEGCDVDFVNVTVGYTSIVNFSVPLTNNSNAGPGDLVNFSINVSTNDECLSHYRFSSNFSGVWQNSSWYPIAGCAKSIRVSYVDTAPSPGSYAWRFYVNSTNALNGSSIENFNFSTKTLSVEWAQGSDIDSSLCTQGSNCHIYPQDTFIANATVTCDTNPPGLSCGSLSGGIMYNTSSSSYDWISTSVSAVPFYVQEAENPVQDFATLSDGQSYILDYNVNATEAGKRKLIFNFTSSLANNPPENDTYPAYLNISYIYGILEVSLQSPQPLTTTNVLQDQVFSMNATVTCSSQDSRAICGIVNGASRYNFSSSNPDVNVNSTEGDKPFYTLSGNPQSCGSMDYYSPPCQLNWSVNASGDIGNSWNMDAEFASSFNEVPDNHTEDARISIMDCVIDVTIEFDSILFSNSTYQPVPNSYGNPAMNNSDDFYNITVNPGSCTIDMHIKSTDLECTSPQSVLGASNMTFSSDSETYESSIRFSNDYQMLKTSLSAGTEFMTWYWLDIPPVYAGDYTGTVTIASVNHGETP